MLIGILFGLIMSQMSFGKILIVNYVKPFGTIFINSLKLIAIPLILASLIKGISDLKDISKLSMLGSRTIALYLMTTVIAVSIGLTVVNIVKPGKSINNETRIDLLKAYGDDIESKRELADNQKETEPLKPLIDLVPDNIFLSLTENKNMLQVIFFSIFFGIGLILLPKKKSKSVKKFIDSLNHVILKEGLSQLPLKSCLQKQYRQFRHQEYFQRVFDPYARLYLQTHKELYQGQTYPKK